MGHQGYAWDRLQCPVCCGEAKGRPAAGHPELSCALPFSRDDLPLVRAAMNWLACQKQHFPGSGTQKITDNTREEARETEEGRSKW